MYKISTGPWLHENAATALFATVKTVGMGIAVYMYIKVQPFNCTLKEIRRISHVQNCSDLYG